MPEVARQQDSEKSIKRVVAEGHVAIEPGNRDTAGCCVIIYRVREFS